MEKILQNESAKERLDILRTNAEGIEDFTYSKPITPEELDRLKSEVVKTNIEIAKLEESKKNFMDNWKLEKKPKSDQLDHDLGLIRSGVKEITETVFLMADQESGEMKYYNAAGECVFYRPLYQNERQLRIFNQANEK